MIEKVMKAVKRGNKKRSRNITIGAVIGFLLSCTAVMGADDNYLWIKEDGGTIQFTKEKDTTGSGTDWGKTNPYTENNWNGSTYINNMTLSSSENNGKDTNGNDISYGLRLSGNLIDVNFVNNGSIMGIGTDFTYGIYNTSIVKRLTNNGLVNGTETDESYGTYNEKNADIEVLTNNGLIIGAGISYGCGIYNNGTITTLINNGLITGTVETGTSSGVYNGDTITTLINSGLITTGIGDGNFGICNDGTITTLINSGLITTGIGEGNSGIYNSDTITTLTNSGLITTGIGDYNSGIYNNGTITTLINNGSITGQNSGIENNDTIINLINNGLLTGENYGISTHETIENLLNNGSFGDGIYNNAGINILMNNGLIKGEVNIQGTITTLENIGVIYNNEYEAIYIQNGTLDTINNYGILITKADSVIDNEGDLNHENNYGLYITEEERKITLGDAISSPVEIVVGYDKDGNKIKRKLTVKNAELEGDSGKATETVSFLLAGEVEKFDNSILNGKNETLKVSGTGNQITDSIINAYGTAVVMKESMSTLILENTIVNGGLSGDNAVKIEGNGNTLVIQGDSIINGGNEVIEENTVITVKGENNAVVLEGNTIINGKMESEGNNTLSLNGNTENGMNMLHDISGFVNMNIENNVTFFEDIKVTGTETVTVHKDGVLNLRLKKDTTTYSTIPTAVHAFSGTDSTTIKGASEEEAGTLNFITNGIGREIYVDMKNIELENMKVRANSIIDKVEISDEYIHLGAGSDLSGIVNPKVSKYDSLDNIYKSLYSSTEENLDALRDILSMTYLGTHYGYNTSNEEQLKNLMSYLDSIYTGTPYSISSELSRKSMGMFRDIITENQFRPDLNRWLVMGGLTHTDGGTKDSYYGQNYHGFDTGTADVDVDMKLTGAYALGKYGYSENVSLGVTAGGNKSEAKLPMAKVKGNSGYVGAFAENYRGNLTLKAGAGIQYSEYDANRATLGGHSYSEKYSDMAYDIYLNGRYSHNIGNNLFLEPYGTLSYTYIKQDNADEGSKVLAIETDSKSFDYTAVKVGADLKKVIPHEKGKSTLSAGVSYTRLLTGADEENITGRFKGENATDFDILVAHKNEHNIGLNAKYALEMENGILFDVKGSYSVERDSHNGTGKNRNKGEWIVGAGLGYKF